MQPDRFSPCPPPGDLENAPVFSFILLGTGHGYSVFDMVHAFEVANGVKVPYEITARRPGDFATCYADPAKSLEVLGWKAEKNLVDMCRDTWNWQKQNPNGYEQ